MLFDEEFYKPFENEDKTVITESLSELQAKLENMNDDNSTWDVLFIIDSKEFLELVHGKLDPVFAFTVGKLKVEGDLGKALEIQKLIKK